MNKENLKQKFIEIVGAGAICGILGTIAINIDSGLEDRRVTEIVGCTKRVRFPADNLEEIKKGISRAYRICNGEGEGIIFEKNTVNSKTYGIVNCKKI